MSGCGSSTCSGARRSSRRIGRLRRTVGSGSTKSCGRVAAWEAAAEPPYDEHRLALQQLLSAVELRSRIHGGLDKEGKALRARCVALL